MFGIIAVSLSLLVIVAGMFLLAKSKKDNLGNLYIFSSYGAIVVGLFLFFVSIVGGLCMMRSCHGSASSCYAQSQGGHCGMKSCAGMSCKMHGSGGCGHHGAMSCGAHGKGGMKSCGMKGHGMSKAHHMSIGDDKTMKVEVEIENEDEETSDEKE